MREPENEIAEREVEAKKVKSSKGMVRAALDWSEPRIITVEETLLARLTKIL